MLFERAQNVSPENVQAAIRALLAMGPYFERFGLEPTLLELVKMRASQINHCAYCIDMHSKDARAQGETEQRLYLLNAWRESRNFYSERELAALAWTEAVTLLTESHVPDAVYEEVRASFTDDEIVSLTMAVVAINSFNRMNVALRTVPGGYQPVTNGRAAAVAAAQ